MATISTFRPAETPQNQQFFQLPFNEMYKVLSDTQTRSDAIVADAEALSTLPFNNLPQHEMEAQAARSWITNSVDQLSEQYGKDPLKWSSGLQALKKEVKRRFDPATGDIGAMQNAYNKVVAYNADVDERYKDDPQFAKYFKSQVAVAPLAVAMKDQVTAGVTLPTEARNVSEKEVTEFFNTTLGQIEKTTLDRFNLSKYGDLNSYITAWSSGERVGIDPQTVLNAIYSQIPPEYYRSYYQKAKVYGAANPEQELQPFQLDDQGNIVKDNGYFGLNPNNTISQKIFGAATGKASIIYDDKYITVEDALLKDDLVSKKKAAEAKTTKPFVGVQYSGVAYQQASPWGTTEASVNDYVSKQEGLNNDIARGILADTPLEPAAKKLLLDNVDSKALYEGTVTAIKGDESMVSVIGKDGNTYTVPISQGTLADFKGKYEYNWTQAELAKQDLKEASTTAEEYIKTTYGEDIKDILSGNTEVFKTLPVTKAGDQIAVISSISKYDTLTKDISYSMKNSLDLYFKDPSAQTYPGEEVSSVAKNAIESQFTKEQLAEIGKYYANKKAMSAEDFSKYRTANIKNAAAVSDYYSKQSEQLAPNLAFTGVITNDYGLDPVSQEAFQKQLNETFAFGNVGSFYGYAPNQKEKMTFDALLKQSAKGQGVKLDEAKVELSTVGRMTVATPDGLHHWQATYTVTPKEGAPYSMQVLFPDDAQAGGAGFPALKSVTNSAYGRASDAANLAKMFGLHTFTLPDMPNIELRWDPNDDRILVNGQRKTIDEGIAAMAVEYMIHDIMQAYNEDYTSAAIRYQQMNSGIGLSPAVGETGPVEVKQ